MTVSAAPQQNWIVPGSKGTKRIGARPVPVHWLRAVARKAPPSMLPEPEIAPASFPDRLRGHAGPQPRPLLELQSDHEIAPRVLPDARLHPLPPGRAQRKERSP